MRSAEQQKRVDDLCRQIAEEKDDEKLSEAVRELNDLLAIKYPPTTSPQP
jgi:hypothetical protein